MSHLPRSLATRSIKGRLIGFAAFLFAAFATPTPANAANRCQAVAGTWNWFTGGVVTLDQSGSVTLNNSSMGSWRCLDSQAGRIEIKWVALFVDDLTLSLDGSRLSGSNNVGTPVTASRAGTAPKAVAGKPAAPVGTAAASMTVRFVNASRYTPRLRLFSEDGTRVWPTRSGSWSVPSGQTRSFALSCNAGEGLVFGGGVPGADHSWGVGLNRQWDCPANENCTYRCVPGGTTTISFD